MNEALFQRLVEAFEQMARAMLTDTPVAPQAAPASTPAEQIKAPAASPARLWTLDELKQLAEPWKAANQVQEIKKILVSISKVKLGDLTTIEDQQKFLAAMKVAATQLPTAQQQAALNLINA